MIFAAALPSVCNATTAGQDYWYTYTIQNLWLNVLKNESES